ncbi:MAG: DEAD/DEAH box helicase, partial [Devosia sp.]|nr:DEAD/DEAH box helicase [Devosia sp.]
MSDVPLETQAAGADAQTAADAQGSAAFDLLHEKVRRWIWRQGWTELRDIQERSIPVLLDGKHDLIIAAGTASGKTEAAFLPIVSRLAWDARPVGAGFEAIYVSPLRALINDQFGRIETLCEVIGLPVTKWHGDVAASVKARARKNPHGILLTTPESLEAILVRRGNEAARLFAALGYIVVDEMHAFMDSERGRQLQSLLNRVEIAAGHRVARVALSATLADMRASAAFLRPLDPDAVDILESKTGGQELRLQVR